MDNSINTTNPIISIWKGTESEFITPEITLTVYRPLNVKANGTAVIIFPGGGYGHLSEIKEGSACAEWLNEFGVTAFVLKYRVAPLSQHPAPLMDAQRAIRIVRMNASKWDIKPDRIGVWGFSAGGHLAATAGTHFDLGNADSKDDIERISCRPDFMILAYPVITMDIKGVDSKYSHSGTRRNLIGENPSDDLVYELSNEKHVNSSTPPAFIFTTDEDKSVPSENSVLFYLALKKAEVPAELHIYRTGSHGLGLAQQNPLLKSWPDLLQSWLNGMGFLEQ